MVSKTTNPAGCIQETKDGHHLKVKLWENMFQANGPNKEAIVATSICNKIDFKPKLIRRDRKGYNIIVQANIHFGDIGNLNIC